MKRIIAAITALGISAALLAGFAGAVNAQPLQGAQPEPTTSTDSPKYDEKLSVYAKQKSVWEAPETGVTFKVPENIKDLKGQFSFVDVGEVQYGDNIYICDMEYYPKTDKEAFNFYDIYYSSSDMTQELVEATQDYVFSRCYLASIVAVKEGKNLNEADNLLDGTVKELGTVGGYNYYYIFTDFDTIAQSLSDNVPAEMRAELKTLCEQLPEYPNAMTLTGPKRPVQATEIGTKVSFETTDLEGNVLTNPVGGAFFDQYDEKIAEALAIVEE